jgi:hypothetical protein
MFCFGDECALANEIFVKGCPRQAEKSFKKKLDKVRIVVWSRFKKNSSTFFSSVTKIVCVWLTKQATDYGTRMAGW